MNVRYSDMNAILYTVACEMFANLEQVHDLHALEMIDLGKRGREFYGSVA